MFKADFGNFSELVTDNGTVIRRVEQAGGGATYTVVAENVNPDNFMANEGSEGDWYEIDEETAQMWVEAANS